MIESIAGKGAEEYMWD